MPYVEFTPRWAAGLVGAGSAVQYRAGPGPRLLKVGGWHLAPLICFESTYPELVSHYRRLGAEVIVNVSNDSWFDRGAAPRQHFAMTLFRAVETGLPIVRVANTGVSAVVAADGRITYALETKVPGVALVEVHGGAAAESFYVCHGDAFAWLAVLLACACLLAARRSV